VTDRDGAQIASYAQGTSSTEHKRRTQSCKEVIAQSQNLLPGRVCDSNSQCKSQKCKMGPDWGSCEGIQTDSNCHSHADCQEGNYCYNLNYWPYQSRCAAYLNERMECTENA